MCMEFELIEKDMDGRLKEQLEEKIRENASQGTEKEYIKIALVHWSDWANENIEKHDDTHYDLVLFFSQDEFPKPTELNGENKQGWSDREWGVPTNYLIDYFDNLVDYLKS